MSNRLIDLSAYLSEAIAILKKNKQDWNHAEFDILITIIDYSNFFQNHIDKLMNKTHLKNLLTNEIGYEIFSKNSVVIDKDKEIDKVYFILRGTARKISYRKLKSWIKKKSPTQIGRAHV